jgi:predicted transcriptional regulator
MDTNILTIFTETDREEIKKAVKQLIINQVESDLRESYNYLFDPDELHEMIEEAINEVKEEVKPLIKEKLLKDMMSKLEL